MCSFLVFLSTFIQGFPGSSDGKEYACSAGDLGSIPGLEDPMEKGMATHSSILAQRIPGMEDPGGFQGVTKSWTQLND